MNAKKIRFIFSVKEVFKFTTGKKTHHTHSTIGKLRRYATATLNSS